MDCVEDERHEVRVALRAFAHRVEGGLDSDVVAFFFHFAKFPDLVLTDARVDLEELALGHVFVDVELVDADDDAVAGLYRLLVVVGGVLDVLLRIALFDCGHHSAEVVDFLDVGERAFFDFLREGFDRVASRERVDDVGDAGLVGDYLLRAERDADALVRRKREGFVKAVGVERLRAAADRGHRLDGDADDVVLRLLRGERAARRLGVEAEHLRARVGDAEALLHYARPDLARGAELRDLFEEVVVRVEEEREAFAEYVRVLSGLDGGFDVGDAVGEGEGDFLNGGRAGLADVVAGDGDGVPFRDVARAEIKDVRDETHRRLGREDVGSARDVFLEDVVLDGSREGVHRDALLLRDGDVHRKKYRRRGVDGHRGRDLVEGDAVEEYLRVGKAVYRDADLAALADRHRVVGVVAYLGRKVERDRKSRRTLAQQVAVTLVGILGGREARVLAHRPEAPSVHRGLHAARVGEYAGESEILGVVHAVHVFGSVRPLEGDASAGREVSLSFGAFGQRLFDRRFVGFLSFCYFLELCWFEQLLRLLAKHIGPLLGMTVSTREYAKLPHAAIIAQLSTNCNI